MREKLWPGLIATSIILMIAAGLCYAAARYLYTDWYYKVWLGRTWPGQRTHTYEGLDVYLVLRFASNLVFCLACVLGGMSCVGLALARDTEIQAHEKACIIAVFLALAIVFGFWLE